MWRPTKGQRFALLGGAAALLATVMVGGFAGPLAQLTYGPMSPAQSLQLQLLSLGAIASAALFALAFLDAPGLRPAIPAFVGFLVAGLGLYLSFGVWVPNNGDATRYGWIAPFSQEGADLMLWGIVAFLAALSFLRYAQVVHARERAGPLASPGQRQ